VLKKKQVSKIKSMQHVLVASQQEKSSSHRILIFVISLFRYPPALDARGHRPVRPLSLHATAPTIHSIHINTIFSYSIFGMFEND